MVHGKQILNLSTSHSSFILMQVYLNFLWLFTEFWWLGLHESTSKRQSIEIFLNRELENNASIFDFHDSFLKRNCSPAVNMQMFAKFTKKSPTMAILLNYNHSFCMRRLKKISKQIRRIKTLKQTSHGNKCEENEEHTHQKWDTSIVTILMG